MLWQLLSDNALHTDSRCVHEICVCQVLELDPRIAQILVPQRDWRYRICCRCCRSRPGHERETFRASCDSRIIRPRLTRTLAPHNSPRADLCNATGSPVFCLTKVVFSPAPRMDFPLRDRHFTHLPEWRLRLKFTLSSKFCGTAERSAGPAHKIKKTN